MPEMVKLVSERCKTIQNVNSLIKEGVIPPAISGWGTRIDLEEELQTPTQLGSNDC